MEWFHTDFEDRNFALGITEKDIRNKLQEIADECPLKLFYLYAKWVVGDKLMIKRVEEVLYPPKPNPEKWRKLQAVYCYYRKNMKSSYRQLARLLHLKKTQSVGNYIASAKSLVQEYGVDPEIDKLSLKELEKLIKK